MMKTPEPTLMLYRPSWQRVAERVRAIAPGLRVLTMDDGGQFELDGNPQAVDAIQPHIAWMNIEVFGCSNRDIFINAMLTSETLDWVQTAAAGLDAPMFATLREHGVRLSNSDAQAPPIADFAVGSVLAYLQGYERRRSLQTNKQWEAFRFRELGGTHWLIIGYGSIGRETARRVKGFGARVTGIRRQPTADEFADHVASLADVNTVLPDADVVMLACPLNDDTRGLVDAKFLARMKPDSILVNVGRGALVVEPDLLAALDGDVPAHAILDVFATEPLPESDPLWHHPKVLISSHASSFGDGMSERGDTLFLDNLRRYLTDQPLRKEVG